MVGPLCSSSRSDAMDRMSAAHARLEQGIRHR